MNSIKDIEAIKSDLAQAAQEIYDDWQQDDDGYDEEVGHGGICHLIADAMLSAMWDSDISEVFTVSSDHEVHVYCVAQVQEGIALIDIPWSTYETGGGYTWTKINGIKFDENDLTIQIIDGNPDNIKNYVEEYYEE